MCLIEILYREIRIYIYIYIRMENIDTSDSFRYHKTLNKKKIDIIDSFIDCQGNEIKSLLDIGCNAGTLSYKYNNIMKVKGLDISSREDLRIPTDYDFNQCDISKMKSIETDYDLILFLSIYHHLLGKYGINYADKIFLMILTKCKYLIFDVGNVSEKERKKCEWYKQQKLLFSNEKELLNHFGLPYKIIGDWNVANGTRTVVVFENKNLNDNISFIEKFRRLDGSAYRHTGLVKEENWKKYDNIFAKRDFYKLKIGTIYVFAKELNETNINEYENTEFAYKEFSYEKLPFMFGKLYIEKLKKWFILFEWIENIKFSKIIKSNSFIDVQQFVSDGKEYYIDFEV